jgi:predicted branched-subunit amino acid permease
MYTTTLATPTHTGSMAAGPFAAGARAITPLVMGTAPYALAIGAASSGLGIDRLTTWIGSWSMVAGTAQLTAMQLLHEGAAPVVALVAALVVNARFAVYSGGLVQWFPTASRRERLLIAFPLVDQVFMTATAAFEVQPMDHRERRSFYLGAAALFVTAWVAAESVGLIVGDRLPDWLGLHSAAILALVGLLATSLTSRRARTAALTSAIVAVTGAHLPVHSVVLVATIAGIAFGAARSDS